jgi:hypothetical protein
LAITLSILSRKFVSSAILLYTYSELILLILLLN